MINRSPTGLALHPSSKRGRGKWVLRYLSPVTQKRRNSGLGIYPEISIAEAGKLAAVMREQLAAGIDPLESQKVEKVVIPTFEEAARTVHTGLKSGWKNEKHSKQWLTTLEKHAFQHIGSIALDAFAKVWDDKYPQISKSWRAHWENLNTLFSYPPDIRKAIYTTNAIESLNSVIRAAIKKRKVFPTDDSVQKVIYLAIKDASKKWSMPIQNWRLAMSRFIIEFGDRLSDHL